MCSIFDCINEINNTHIDNAKYLDLVIPMLNLIHYSDNYSKITGILSQYYRAKPDDDIRDSKSFEYKSRITYNTGNAISK